jgi:predicted RNase H-like HicB family nuclease
LAKYVFPALFDPGQGGSPGYTVTFPDLPGCITEGADFTEAMIMAKDALVGYLYAMEEDKDDIPTPTAPDKVELTQGAFVVLVEAWTDIVRDEMENKAIKKTLTLPKWLNDAAEKEGVNFSHLLQYALKQQLGIKDKRSE